MIAGVCHICGAPALHTCSMCGKTVCDAHYVAEMGVCTECARGLHGTTV